MLPLLLLTLIGIPEFLVGQEAVGHVVDLRGNWYIYPEGAESVQAKKLSKWEDVAPGGVIRVKSPLAGDYITIVDPQLKALVAKKCDSSMGCYQPIILPRSLPSQKSLLDLKPLWDALIAEAYLPSLHRVRGRSPILSEGVARLSDSQLDLGESMNRFPKGGYSLRPYDIQGSGVRTAKVATFKWDPDSGTIVSVRSLTPGLYEAVRDPSSQVEPRMNDSLVVLICDLPGFPAALSSFRNIVTMTDKWENATTETVHTFLRAYLVELATTWNTAKQP